MLGREPELGTQIPAASVSPDSRAPFLPSLSDLTVLKGVDFPLHVAPTRNPSSDAQPQRLPLSTLEE